MRALVGNALVALGIGLFALTGVLYLYGEYERLQFERRQADFDRFEQATATAVAVGEIAAAAQARGLATATALALARLPTATPEPPTATPAGYRSEGSAAYPAPGATRTAEGARAGESATPASQPLAAPPSPTPPPPSPTAAPAVKEIRRIVARSIALDAPVVEAKLRNREWDVPKFVAGHLEGTAMPGAGGNVVLSGHIQSLTSGNVFAQLGKLQIGDEVVLRTNVGEISYRITGRNVVANDDLSVVRPTAREEVTLITCTGAFNPLTRDYSHRLVVWGERAG